MVFEGHSSMVISKKPVVIMQLKFEVRFLWFSPGSVVVLSAGLLPLHLHRLRFDHKPISQLVANSIFPCYFKLSMARGENIAQKNTNQSAYSIIPLVSGTIILRLTIFHPRHAYWFTEIASSVKAQIRTMAWR